MSAADKDLMLAIIRDQPDDNSYDDLLRRLALHRIVDRGIADVDQHQLTTTRELRSRIKEWSS
ncbi:MAG: hypothetical protein V3T72_11710 [Thermoanaerobaculia bacterium]